LKEAGMITPTFPRIIAHRGASADAPENTLAAFSLAAEMGADFFELDCSLTRDGAVAVIHDARAERTTSGTGEVAHLDLAALQELDAGSWKDPRFAGERIPTLGQALQLAAAREVGVYVELKCWEQEGALLLRWLRNRALPARVLEAIAGSAPEALRLVEAVLQDIERSGWSEHVVVQSFSPVMCAAVRAKAPHLPVALLGSAETAAAWSRLYALARICGCHGINLCANDITRAHVEAVHHAGKTMDAWTVDDEEEMRKLARWGVDGIITNKPDVCRRVIETLGSG
jgi:glycerophosphoryl diester phosphodiesterase